MPRARRKVRERGRRDERRELLGQRDERHSEHREREEGERQPILLGLHGGGNLRRFGAGVKDFVRGKVTSIYRRMVTGRATRPKLERRRARRLAGRGAGLRCSAS